MWQLCTFIKYVLEKELEEDETSPDWAASLGRSTCFTHKEALKARLCLESVKPVQCLFMAAVLY